ncbi:PucR family transcriptional regulator [Agromyces silvae]|uniref:PucR family transcriptional regulator n=1 Tax=Agromyces silvae TaxID=3388266 RepID=UPI00280B385C|nr:helix-turn-helix domain-containing protein [Agromyces protaetiae]
MSDPDPFAQADLDSETQASLFDLFKLGSRMFERPSVAGTVRLASASARALTGCVVRTVYIAADAGLVRYSGRANRRLDLAVEARAGTSGVLEHGDVWRYVLFFWGTGKVRGAFVLQSSAEPSSGEMFLLHALAEPTGAALATADLIDRERRHARELSLLGETQAGSNRTMAATIARLSSHQHIRDSLLAAAGTGDGEAQIVETLSDILRRSVMLQDSFGNERVFIAAGGPAGPSSALLPDGRPSPAGSLSAEWRSTLIRARGETLGVIGIYDPDDSRSDIDRFAVEYASAMIAVELAHRREIAEVEIRLGRDLADDLVEGTVVVDGLARAEALHFDLSGAQRVVLVIWESPTPNGVDLGAALRHELAAMRVPALITRRSEVMLAVVADGHDLSSLYERLSTAVCSTRGTIGIGGRYLPGDLALSFGEARRALHIRAESRRPFGISNHDDLGLLRILDTSGDGAELERFVSEWLGTLIEHDRAHRSDLVRTLGVYLDAGGNYDRTAKALIIHRSTLRYRLGRIREVSGRDVADPDSRLNLHIATRIRSAMRDDLR